MKVTALAQKLIQFATVTPQGSDCLDFISDYLINLGFQVTRLPFGSGDNLSDHVVDNLFARKGSTDPHLMYVGHVDVVPPGDGWMHSPFAGVVEDGVLYGRGAVDMKGAIAAFLAALPLVESQGSVSILLTCDEEGPANNGVVKVIPWLEANHHLPTCALVGEPTSVNCLGDTIKNGRRGSISFDIATYGHQGHVAYPQLANNAATPLVALLNNLIATPLDAGTSDFQPSNLEIVKLHVPNDAYNVIAGVACASVNIRFNPLHSFASLEAYLNLMAKKVEACYPGINFAIAPLPAAEPFISSSAAWVAMVAKAVTAETGVAPTCSTSGGTSDARFIHKICPVVELGLLNKTAHHVDEHVLIADLQTLQGIYARVLAIFFGAKTFPLPSP